jgi:hypothetical protein
MLLRWTDDWNDPRSAWWVKANRAQEHLNTLARLVEEFRQSEPYTLKPEATDKPDRFAHRLRYRHPVPVEISATVGDVLHNMRAALESLAFELGLRSNGRSLTSGQERKSTFPICKSPDDFEKFFKDKPGLFDDRAKAALRAVQDFVILEQSRRYGIGMDKTWEENQRWSVLHRLNILWNIDKHRRLIPVAWWPDMIYWGSNGPSNREAFPGDGTLEDGSVLLYTEGRDEGMGTELNHDFNLVLTDDPAFSRTPLGAQEDLVGLLQRWHDRIVRNSVFPGVFTLMCQ